MVQCAMWNGSTVSCVAMPTAPKWNGKNPKRPQEEMSTQTICSQSKKAQDGSTMKNAQRFFSDMEERNPTATELSGETTCISVSHLNNMCSALVNVASEEVRAQTHVDSQIKNLVAVVFSRK